MVATSMRRPLANNGQVNQQNNNRHRSEGFVNPVRGAGTRTSGFGMRTHPISGQDRHHDGVDIAAPTGTPVGASRSGRVVFAGDRRDGYGNQVVVDHGNGVQTRYAHLNDINVENGAELRQGQQLGTVGSTGNSTGPHLHFEIIRNGQVVNPTPILAGTQSIEDAPGVRHASVPNGSAPTSRGTPTYASNQGGHSGGGLPSYQQAAYSPGYRQTHYPSSIGGSGMGSGSGGGIDIERLLQMAEEMGISVEELLHKILSGEIDPREISGGGGSRSGGSRSGGVRRGGGTARTSPGNGRTPVRGRGGRMDPKNIYQMARQAGFNENQAVTMTAIAMAESGGNPNAHNPNASTGDNSYGLWQINMLGNMGPQRRQSFGIASNDALFDPQTNAHAARDIFQSQGFNAWSVYRSGAYRNYLDEARQAAASSSASVA